MDIGSMYHFLFETMPGNGVMIAVVLVVSLLISIILERRTRKIYTNHESNEDDWFAFDDEEISSDSDSQKASMAKSSSSSPSKTKPSAAASKTEASTKPATKAPSKDREATLRKIR